MQSYVKSAMIETSGYSLDLVVERNTKKHNIRMKTDYKYGLYRICKTACKTMINNSKDS
jgi:hypothetical protein